MSYNVIWSPKAKESYFANIEYILNKWTEKEAFAFIDRVEEVISFIKNNPFLYPYSTSSDTFKCLVVKQIALFYRIKSENIELLLFWNTSQDPSKLDY